MRPSYWNQISLRSIYIKSSHKSSITIDNWRFYIRIYELVKLDLQDCFELIPVNFFLNFKALKYLFRPSFEIYSCVPSVSNIQEVYSSGTVWLPCFRTNKNIHLTLARHVPSGDRKAIRTQFIYNLSVSRPVNVMVVRSRQIFTPFCFKWSPPSSKRAGSDKQ